MLIMITITFQGPRRVPRKPAKSGKAWERGLPNRVEKHPCHLSVHRRQAGQGAQQEKQGQGGGKGAPSLRESQCDTGKTSSPAYEEWWSLSPPPNWAGLWLGLWWKWGSVRPAGQALAVPRALLSPSLPWHHHEAGWRERTMGQGAGQRGLQPRERAHQILRDHTLPSHISSHSAGKWLLPRFSNV